jgi:hypothetical protein
LPLISWNSPSSFSPKIKLMSKNESTLSRHKSIVYYDVSFFKLRFWQNDNYCNIHVYMMLVFLSLLRDFDKTTTTIYIYKVIWLKKMWGCIASPTGRL